MTSLKSTISNGVHIHIKLLKNFFHYIKYSKITKNLFKVHVIDFNKQICLLNNIGLYETDIPGHKGFCGNRYFENKTEKDKKDEEDGRHNNS